MHNWEVPAAGRGVGGRIKVAYHREIRFQELIGLKRPKERRSSEIANVSLFRRLESPFQTRKDRGSLGDLGIDQNVPRREVYQPVSPTLIAFLLFIHHSF